MNELNSVYIIPILVNLISNALYSLLTNFLPDDTDKTSLEQSINKIIDDICQSFEWKGSVRVEEVCLFLDSPEIQQVIEQLFSVNIAKKTLDLANIEKEFVLLFRNYFANATEYDTANIKSLFNLIQQVIIKSLIIKIEDKGYKELLALFNYRFNRVEKTIDGITKNLEFLYSIGSINIIAINEFEKKYISQVANRLQYIKLYNLDTTRRIFIDEIYITPRIQPKQAPAFFIGAGGMGKSSLSQMNSVFASPGFKDNATDIENVFVIDNVSKSFSFQYNEKYLETNELYPQIDKTVILGNPGGGKTTLTYKICSDIHKYYDKRLINNKLLTPIHITVREYGENKSKYNCSILQFIESHSNSHYQLPAPKGAFEYLLHNSKALLIFDGLDELLDTSYRREIVDDIESFCNLYPNTPVLITSREVGYEQAPLNEKEFKVFTLKSFDEDQIKEYAEKWFKLDTELTYQQQKEKVDAFLKESEVVSDIRSNPLMLGLMCSIYRGENYIPQNRPDLYEKCSVMLFEKWDKSRGINPNIPFEAHLRPGMMHLAYWIYTTQNLKGGVTESSLIQQTTNYLLKYYENRNEAELIAEQFVNFCKGRAWVFTDVGDGIYQFTHQTFLEYFTACHLNRTLRNNENLFDLLSDKIEKAEWDVVSQLSIQILDKNFEGAADEMINLLLDRADEKKIILFTKVNFLSFVVRCLKFIVPKYSTKQRIVQMCLDVAVEVFIEKIVENTYHHLNPLELINALLRVNSDNEESIITIFRNYLVDEIEKAEYIRLKPLFVIINEIEDLIDELTLQKIKSLLKSLPNNDKFLALLQHHYNVKTEYEIFEIFGLEILVYDTNPNVHIPSIEKPLFLLLLQYLSNDNDVDNAEKEKASNFLKAIYKYFEDKDEIKSNIDYRNIGKNWIVDQIDNDLSNEELFGAFLIVAIIVEKNSQDKKWIKNSIKKELIFGKSLGNIFLGRIVGIINYRNQIKSQLKKLKFTPQQEAIIWKWVRKEINFLGKN